MPPALQPQPEITTLEQYADLPEDRRVEVFDGVIYDMSSPSQIHQALSMELSNIIYNYIKKRKGTCQAFHAPFDVKLSDKPLTIVQPDIMVICNKDKFPRDFRCAELIAFERLPMNRKNRCPQLGDTAIFLFMPGIKYHSLFLCFHLRKNTLQYNKERQQQRNYNLRPPR